MVHVTGIETTLPCLLGLPVLADGSSHAVITSFWQVECSGIQGTGLGYSNESNLLMESLTSTCLGPEALCAAGQWYRGSVMIARQEAKAPLLPCNESQPHLVSKHRPGKGQRW